MHARNACMCLAGLRPMYNDIWSQGAKRRMASVREVRPAYTQSSQTLSFWVCHYIKNIIPSWTSFLVIFRQSPQNPNPPLSVVGALEVIREHFGVVKPFFKQVKNIARWWIKG